MSRGFLKHDYKYFFLKQIICKHLYGFKYSSAIVIITLFQEFFLSNNNHLFAHSFMVWSNKIRRSLGGCPCDVMVKALEFGIVVREFELQSRYYVHFPTNTLGKGANPLILPSMD